MDKELNEKLFAIEPKWFIRDNLRVSLMGFGFEVGNGWYNLLECLLKMAKWNQTHWDDNKNWALKQQAEGKVHEVYKKYLEPNAVNPFDGFHVSQVKEKFGQLRFYYSGGDGEFHGAVEFAEILSGRICEECGVPGILRGGGWVYTSCEAHAKPGDEGPYIDDEELDHNKAMESQDDS